MLILNHRVWYYFKLKTIYGDLEFCAKSNIYFITALGSIGKVYSLLYM